MAHNPIVRVTLADGKYVQLSVDEDGAFQEEDQVIPPTPTPGTPPDLSIAAVFGDYDIKIVWPRGAASPNVTVNDMSPTTSAPSTGPAPIGGLGG